jgi:uncharacterized protein YndB with AHSA1/START domain
MKTRTEISGSEPTIVMTRTYEAPRELVWEVITEPRHVIQWWGGAGCANPVCEMDVRPGGTWRHVMRFPDGQEIRMHFIFVTVEPPGLLSWKDPRTSFTITLTGKGRQTTWKLVDLFNSLQERDAAVGFGFRGPIEASNDRLAAYLKEIP